MSDSTCLVSFDTDRIKEYLFAAPDLQRIRGASTLLEFLNRGDDPSGSSTKNVIREVCPAIKDEEMIAVGGMAMALVREQLAPQVIAVVESLYRRETVTAGITGAMLPVTKHDLEHGFGDCIAKVSKRLRTAKDQKGQDPLVPLTGWLRPCGSCGRYPASRLSASEGRAELVCRSCAIKDGPGKEVRNWFFEKGFLRYLDRVGRNSARWKDAFPKDFGAIGETAHPSGYLGFIYADGNGMGALLNQMQSFPAFREFALGLDTIVRDITHQALADVFAGPLHGTAPFEILLMGGDDLMLVVAADAALDIAATIVEEFEQRANALAHSQVVGLPPETHLSISAGVVIAHDTFPIQAMHALSSDLVTSAKSKAAEISAELRRSQAQPAGTPDQGTIDFMVVTEAATAGLEMIRSQVLTGGSFFVEPGRGERFVLTERPYTAGQLRKLLARIREFKARGFPNTVLNAMYEALFESKVRAQIATLTAMARAKPDHWRVARRFLEDFHVPDTLLPRHTYAIGTRGTENSVADDGPFAGAVGPGAGNSGGGASIYQRVFRAGAPVCRAGLGLALSHSLS